MGTRSSRPPAPSTGADRIARVSSDAPAATPPSDTHKPEILVITGMSGAGRATTAKVLEDLDWYVVDNLPPALIPPLARLTTNATQALPRVAVVVDVRGGTFFNDLREALDKLSEFGVHSRLLFLDASDPVLVRRFESVRRPHPIQGNERILDGIAREREITQDLRGWADLVIDTTELNVHQLASKLHSLFASESDRGVRLTVISFGFKYGIPVDVDHIVDVRFLPNPYWIPDLRGHTGLDDDVRDYVLAQPGAEEFIDRYVYALAPVLEGYERENRPYVTIGVGCTGGKHRSVAITERIAARLAHDGVRATAMHRDLGRE